MSRILVRIVPFALVALLLAGCGNKGDLVKPTPPKPAESAQQAQDAGQR
ncbi:lipoprotein [Dokdonella sp.]|nr:lipoprotein [Dokdonella sp.]MBO9664483.1 hypothetical protein [Dokdonella sp.]